MWSKTLFYMIANPPGIVLSLLPAPQQAILIFNAEKSYSALYSTEEERAHQEAALKSEVEEKEEEDLDELEEKKAKGGRGKIEQRRRKRR